MPSRLALFTRAKIGLLSAAGPLAIALFFVVVWISCVPAMEWTDNEYRAWNVTEGARLEFTLVLFLVELPLAVGLGILLSYQGVTSYWSAGLTGATVAACLSIVPVAGLGCLSWLASVGHNVMTGRHLAEMIGAALVFLTKEVAAGVSCGVIAAANVRRSNRNRKGSDDG